MSEVDSGCLELAKKFLADTDWHDDDEKIAELGSELQQTAEDYIANQEVNRSSEKD